MEYAIKVKYRAIQWDNYQGGSGKPYDGELFIRVSEVDTVPKIIQEADARISDLNKDQFTGEAKLVSINIIPVIT